MIRRCMGWWVVVVVVVVDSETVVVVVVVVPVEAVEHKGSQRTLRDYPGRLQPCPQTTTPSRKWVEPYLPAHNTPPPDTLSPEAREHASSGIRATVSLRRTGEEGWAVLGLPPVLPLDQVPLGQADGHGRGTQDHGSGQPQQGQVAVTPALRGVPLVADRHGDGDALLRALGLVQARENPSAQEHRLRGPEPSQKCSQPPFRYRHFRESSNTTGTNQENQGNKENQKNQYQENQSIIISSMHSLSMFPAFSSSRKPVLALRTRSTCSSRKPVLALRTRSTWWALRRSTNTGRHTGGRSWPCGPGAPESAILLRRLLGRHGNKERHNNNDNNVAARLNANDDIRGGYYLPLEVKRLRQSKVFEDSLKCLYLNGGCEHFCDGSGPRRRCSCAEGFSLADDERQCVAQGALLLGGQWYTCLRRGFSTGLRVT
ncbi:hypothetical protein CRUP_016389 [Coryphaenoides rupestris]|nr:hypothetical protein CRUP_016389 [Coryphaenoides rupestris]